MGCLTLRKITAEFYQKKRHAPVPVQSGTSKPSPIVRAIGGSGRGSRLNSMPFGSWLTVLCLRTVARLPLSWLHRIGAIAGRVAFVCSRKIRNRMLENIRGAGIAGDNDEDVVRFARACAAELGKGVLEILPLWFGRAADMMATIRLDASWDAVQPLLRAGNGVMFLTPHLGGFEVAGQFLAYHMPVTIMYRQPRIGWLAPVFRGGRAQGQAQLTTADTRGVRALLKALKRGEAIGLLPDQVPAQGHGILADFFGRPAYTTTLIGRLQQSTGAPIVVMCTRRLPDAAGFELTFHTLPEPLPADDAEAARALNAFQEDIIRRCPEQYLWSYNRFKAPIEAPTAGRRSVAAGDARRTVSASKPFGITMIPSPFINIRVRQARGQYNRRLLATARHSAGAQVTPYTKPTNNFPCSRVSL